MKLKKIIFVAGALMLLAACGENSTSSETIKDSTASATAGNTGNTISAPSVEPPATSKTHFETTYPNAASITWSQYEQPTTDIEWEWTSWPVLDANDYVVAYSWDGGNYYTWYDDQGNWVGTTGTLSDFSTLPSPVSGAVQKQFNGYTITSVDKENDKNREAYEIKMEKGNDKMKALIAADGTVLKKKGKVDGEKVKEKADVK